jgi:TonB family protein
VTTINVTIEPNLISPARQKPQIVSPSQQPATDPPDNAQRLSDTNSRTEVEKIRRGDGGGIPGQGTSQPKAQTQQQERKPAENNTTHSQQKQPQPKEPAKEEPPAALSKQPLQKKEVLVKDLTLDRSTLDAKFGSQATRPPTTKSPSSPSQSLSEYQAFSRPPGTGAAFLGTAGISDHLPNLPDGDITLLNAKANIYASFVRRVAIQVFTQLRAQGWERLSAQQIRQLQGFATIEAVLSQDGKFIRAQLLDSSGSDAFDSVLNLSVTNGARDPNPPPGALAKDGLIHFIFKARSWSQMGMNRRSGAPVEQRWLLLATGLE